MCARDEKSTLESIKTVFAHSFFGNKSILIEFVIGQDRLNRLKMVAVLHLNNDVSGQLIIFEN